MLLNCVLFYLSIFKVLLDAWRYDLLHVMCHFDAVRYSIIAEEFK
jgi:hypothetical protein